MVGARGVRERGETGDFAVIVYAPRAHVVQSAGNRISAVIASSMSERRGQW